MALHYETTREQLLPISEPPAPDSALRQTLKNRRRQRAALLVVMIAIDAVILFLTFEAVFFLRFKVFGFLYVPEHTPLRFYSELVLWLIPVWLGIFSFYRLYDLKILHGGTSEYRRIAQACSTAIIILLALSFFMEEQLIISRAWLLMVWVFSILLLIVSRFAFRRILYRLRERGIAMTRVLIIGANQETCQVGEQLSGGRNLPGLEVVGFVGERRTKPRHVAVSLDETTQNAPRQPLKWPGRWMGQVENVREIVDAHHIDEVIISSTALSHEELFEVVRLLTTSNVEIRLSPSVYEILTTGLEVQEINGLPFVTISKVRITGLNATLKRALDIVVSFGILFLLSPIWLLCALLVRLDSPGPIIHRRRVVGQGGKLFDAFKFRTMHPNGDEILAANPALQEELLHYGKLKKDPRITRIGKFLRKTSIDEVPQLLNVLFGQMSLVGPRMITYQEMIKFGRWQTNLMTVKPGLTGLWQVSGRSNLTYDDRVRLDMHYIRNYSVWIDMRILFQTVPAVVRGSGAY